MIKYEDIEAEVKISKQIPIDSNRNKLVKEFLDGGFDDLLMIDDDISPPPNILNMLRHGKPIVSATCFVLQEMVPQPLLRDDNGEGFVPMKVDKIEELTKVGGIGTGCFTCKREVFEKIEPPWFLFPRDKWGMLSLGEDYYFSRKAKEAGFDLYVDTTMLCGHMKEIDLAYLSECYAKQDKVYKDKYVPKDELLKQELVLGKE
jgi:hypothetical protein